MVFVSNVKRNKLKLLRWNSTRRNRVVELIHRHGNDFDKICVRCLFWMAHDMMVEIIGLVAIRIEDAYTGIAP